MTTVLAPNLQASRQVFSEIFAAATSTPVQPVRKIDCLISSKEKSMKVLCLGLSRTGTVSLMTALQILGYTPFHMAALMAEAPVMLPILEEALDAKYKGIGKPYCKEEFDKLFGRTDACIELPSHMFAEELLAAYPDAKVIINDRELEGWMKSMNATVGPVMNWFCWRFIAWADPITVGPWWSGMSNLDQYTHYTDSAIPSRKHLTAEAFTNHYANVRKLCAGRANVLEFRPQLGWEPLCKLLGHEVPDMPFPNINDSAMFIKLHVVMYERALRLAVLKVSAAVAVVAVVAWVLSTLGLLDGLRWKI